MKRGMSIPSVRPFPSISPFGGLGHCGQFAPTQVLPGPCGTPPLARQSPGISARQNAPTKQHAWVGSGQLTPAQVVPGPWDTPPLIAQTPGSTNVQLPSG